MVEIGMKFLILMGESSQEDFKEARPLWVIVKN